VHLAIRSSPLVESSAARLLGEHHALTRALERRAAIHVEMLAMVALLVVCGVAGEIGIAEAVPVALVAAPAGVVSWIRAFEAGIRVRGLVLQLIADGRGRLPLPEIEDQCARLLDPQHRRDQVEWLTALAKGEHFAFGVPRRVPPIINRRVVAAAREELMEVAYALSGDERGLAGLALLELVSYEPESPLFGDDALQLREALARVRFRLAA
jgi:hypothetical protein